MAGLVYKVLVVCETISGIMESCRARSILLFRVSMVKGRPQDASGRLEPENGNVQVSCDLSAIIVICMMLGEVSVSGSQTKIIVSEVP